MNIKRIAGIAGLSALFAIACASVSFDALTGTGFVGKGDVQLAFGWNNQALQKNASGVTFTYNAVDTYDVECYWETLTGSGRVIEHDITVPRHTSVNAAIAYDARTHKQIDGFILTGFGDTTIDGTLPVIGETCPGNSDNGTIIGVTLTGSTGGLFVNYGDLSVSLPNTPVL